MSTLFSSFRVGEECSPFLLLVYLVVFHMGFVRSYLMYYFSGIKAKLNLMFSDRLERHYNMVVCCNGIKEVPQICFPSPNLKMVVWNIPHP